MPRYRPDLDGLVTYVPGRPIEDVAREVGIPPSEIVKLASNESPDGPFPGVAAAVRGAIDGTNRYPDSDVHDLSRIMAGRLSVSPDQVWFGAGSTGLLGSIALGVGGPGTSAVYAWPSFVMYRIISRWAGTEPIEVPLTADHAHDLEAMHNAIRPDTTVVYVCNPNNPTGTIVTGDDLESMIRSVPAHCLVVVDEAYHDFVADPGHRSMIDLATNIPNLVVLRTFSKVYALAAHRIGYAVGDADLLQSLRRTQAPFTVSTLAQVAALASLDDDDELLRRVEANAAGRHQLSGVLRERSVPHPESQANFLFFHVPGEERQAVFLEHGVIVRPMSNGWIRVTVGNPGENERFVAALDVALDSGED